MPNPIDNVTLTGTDYQDAATIKNVWGANGGSFAVSGGDVYYRLQYPTPNAGANKGGFGSTQFTPEVRIGQGPGLIPPGVTGVEFRNVSASHAATITAIIAEPNAPYLTLSAPSNISTGTGVTFLGTFTIAQWPPTNPTEGDVALFADTYNGRTFAWLLQYQPSVLGATYPWGPPPSVTLDYAWKNVGNTAGNYRILAHNGWQYLVASGNLSVLGSFPASFDQLVPRAGVWALAGSAGTVNETAAGDTAGVGLSTTNTVSPAAGNFGQVVQAGTNAAGQAAFTAGTVTLATAGATLYAWLYSSSGIHNNDFPALAFGYAPTQIA